MKSFCFFFSWPHANSAYNNNDNNNNNNISAACNFACTEFSVSLLYILYVCVCVCTTIATPTSKTLNRKPINRKVHKQMLILHICIVIRNSKCLQSI